jgi:signal peptidase I
VTTPTLDPLPTDPSDLFSGAHEAVDEMRATARHEADQAAAERSFWRELPLLLLFALVAAVLLKTFVLQSFFIPSESMVETLQVNDRIMVNKLSYRFGEIKRGQVVVFDDPQDAGADGESLLGAALRNVAESVGLSAPRSEFIKRVIALPGETIEIREGVVMIDGAPIEEPYLSTSVRMPDFRPERIPEGHVFVMGDNRALSSDSRVFGPVPTQDVVGRAFVIIWPPSRWGGL